MKKRWIKPFGVILNPLVMILLLSPMDIWVGNKTQFNFNWGDFFWGYLLAFIVCLILGTVIISAFPEKVRYWIETVVFELSFMAYLQVMFLNTKIKSDSGGKMPWNELHSLMIGNLLIWLCLISIGLIIAYRYKKYWNKIIGYGSVFLALMQSIAVLFCIITNLKYAGFVKETYIFGNNNQYKVAKNNNVIVFVLDTFGSAQLDLALEQDPECLKNLKDFVYYNNADSVYYRTLPSMTHILTGKEYEVEKTVGNWTYDAWHEEKTVDYYSKLHNHDFNCYLYSNQMYYTYVNGKNLVDKFDNIVNGKAIIPHREWLFSKLTKMTLYKHLPYVLKPKFEVLSSELDTIVESVGTGACETSNDGFKNKLLLQKLAVDDAIENALIVQHLGGTHDPYHTDENGNYSEDEVSVVQTARGVLKIVDLYLEELKKINKYNNSTIIIIADHGAWELDDRMDPQIIFFVKRPNQQQESIVFNAAPVCNCDILPTIYDVLDLDYSEYGKSVFDWNENDERERTIYILNDDLLQGWTYKTKQELLNKALCEPDISLNTDMY